MSILHWLHGSWAILLKDLKLELRNRYALNALLIFVLSTILIVLLGIGEDMSTRAQAGLLWIVILFSAAVGLGRSFVAEEEGKTALLLRLHTRGSMVYAGKLVFTFVLGLSVSLVSLGAFVLLLNVTVAHPYLLFLTLLLGTLGLSGVTTFLAAIMSRTAQRGPLLPVLLFPLLFPLLLTAIDATHACFEGGAVEQQVVTLFNFAGAVITASAFVLDIVTLFSYAGAFITASVLLFDYLWND